MSGSTITPNPNFLGQTTYRLVIDQTRFANLEYYAVSAKLPSVNMDGVSLPFKNAQNFATGDRVEYAPLDLRFVVDENMANYIELLNWLRDNASSDSPVKSDIILTVHSSKNNVVRRIRFADAFPISIGELNFESQAPSLEYIDVQASFRYTYFEFLT